MVLATTDDVEKRLGRAMEADELAQAEGLLEEASALVEGWCRREFPAPAPAPVTVVVSRMVARALDAAAGDDLGNAESESMSAGPYQVTTKFVDGSTSGGPWLTRVDKTTLARFRRGVVNVAMY